MDLNEVYQQAITALPPAQIAQWLPGDEVFVPSQNDPTIGLDGRIYKLYRDQSMAVVRGFGTIEVRVKIQDLRPKRN